MILELRRVCSFAALLGFAFLSVGGDLIGQDVSPHLKDRVRGALIYNLAKQIEWESYKAPGVFRIGIAGDERALYLELRSALQDRMLRDRQIDVVRVDGILEEPVDVDLLFVARSFDGQLGQISSRNRKANTLLISDGHEELRSVMINLQESEAGQLSFLINRPNLVAEGFGVNFDALVLGGSELDVAKVYRELLDESVELGDRLSLLEKDLYTKSEEIEAANRELEQQKKSFERQATILKDLEALVEVREAEIALQLEQLAELRGEVKTQEKTIVERELKLGMMEAQLNRRQRRLESRLKQIEEARAQIVANNETLAEQTRLIDEQERDLLESSERIDLQRQLLIVEAIAFLGTIVAIILVVRSNRLRVKANTLLADKNQELERSINELNEARQELLDTNEELVVARKNAESAMRAKGVFLSNMSHEIRTPLNAIIGYSQLMSRASSLSENQSQQLASINRSGAHLLELLNDILAVSKTEEGKSRLNIRRFSIRDLGKDLRDMFLQKSRELDVGFYVEVGDEVPRAVLVDSIKLRQVLINLLGNAFKFTTEGRVGLAVSAEKGSENRAKLLFAVSDTGKGIPNTLLETIFRPFEQVPEDGHQPSKGTGLGLAICREFVSLMGGTISVKSEMGEGSCFSFSLDCEVATDEPGEDDGTFPVVLSGQGFRALAVDDDPDSLEVIAVCLARNGFEVIRANSGAAAIEALEANDVDLVVTDVLMEGLSGVDVARSVKSKESSKNTPVVAVTASVDFADYEKEEFQLFDAIFEKPIDLNEVMVKVAKLCQIEMKADEPEPSVSNVDETSSNGSLDTSVIDRIVSAARLGDIGALEGLAMELENVDTYYSSKLKALCDRFALEEIEQFALGAKESVD